jgi:phage terminase small subunit
MAKVKAPLPVATTVVDGERDTEALLTYSQERFAVRYAQTRDPAQSYFYAYDCREDVKPHTLRAAGWELLQNPAVIRRVKQLTKASSLAVDFGIPDVMRVWYEMATADPNELVSYRVGCCRYCRGVGHAYQWREREYLDALAKVERANSLLADARLYEPLPDPSGGLDFNHTLPPVDDCPECHGEGVGRMVACDTTKLSAGARLLYARSAAARPR